jgi:hypothetical protein
MIEQATSIYRQARTAPSCRISWAELERFAVGLSKYPARDPGADGRAERRWRRTVSPDRCHVVPVEVISTDAGPAA